MKNINKRLKFNKHNLSSFFVSSTEKKPISNGMVQMGLILQIAPHFTLPIRGEGEKKSDYIVSALKNSFKVNLKLIGLILYINNLLMHQKRT